MPKPMGRPLLTPLGTAIEVLRPVVLTGAFVAAAVWLPWWATIPFGLMAVFAWSIFVHDMIHNALRLRPPVAELVLGGSALFLIKSGHALRALHVRHHARPLSPSDVEGRVAHASFVYLTIFGPWLAMQARIEAWRCEPRWRRWQAVESAMNVLIMASLAGAAFALWHPGPLVYWGCVVLVTVSAPIWGAKIPHLIPYRHPIVRALTRLTGRLTPAVASVLLHELHHRRPALPVSLLAEHSHELDEAEESHHDPSR